MKTLSLPKIHRLLSQTKEKGRVDIHSLKKDIFESFKCELPYNYGDDAKKSDKWVDNHEYNLFLKNMSKFILRLLDLG